MSSAKPQKKKGWRFRVDLGPLSMALWGIFILFFMGWIFVLGIFVGRGVLPGILTDTSEIKGTKAKLTKSIEAEEDADSYSPDSGVLEEKEPELAFYDKLTTKKDEAKNNFHTDETKADKTVSPAPAEVKRSAGNTGVADSPGGSADRSVQGQYTIQVASITELAKAEKTVKQLIEKGFNAYYYEATVKGRKYYRVRCGKFPDRQEARKYSIRLEEKTGYKGYVTDIE